MLIHVDSSYLVALVDGFWTNAMLVLVKSWIFCGASGWPDRLLSQTRMRPVWRKSLFRVGAPLGWFSAEQPMYGSRLPFGIQRDEGGSKDFSDLAAQTELGTVRTDLHNQSRVKGLA